MGTPSFAVPSLRSLAARHEVGAVYTQPDRPSGRGQSLTMSPVKEAAASLGLEVRQPATLRDDEEVALLDALAPDVICVAAYGLILPSAVLSVPRYCSVNVHASLLPEYRGAAPVHRAILDGKSVTGVSIMRMEEGLDTGPYASRISVPVGDSTVDELTAILADVGAKALIDVLDDIESGRVEWTPQDDANATHARKVTRDDVALDPAHRVDEALRRVRASTRSAPSRLCVGDATLTVTRALPAATRLAPGQTFFDGSCLIAGFADGSIALAEVRPAGRASMDGACFARGARFGPECSWTRCP